MNAFIRQGIGFCLGLACAGLALAQNDSSAPPSEAARQLPPARFLLDQLLSRLPDQPVALQGTLHGPAGGKLRVDMDILARGPEAHGRYRIADFFGAPAAQLEIRRPPHAPPVIRIETGAPPHSVQTPSLNLNLPGSDLLWMDLTLGFLWWKDGKTIGLQELRGQSCYVVDLFSPNPAQDRYAAVRLWIDQVHGMLIQAEAQDPVGNLLRRVTIKSFRKIGEHWMIKDLEIRTLPDNRKTILRIDTLSAPDLPPTPETETVEVSDAL